MYFKKRSYKQKLEIANRKLKLAQQRKKIADIRAKTPSRKRALGASLVKGAKQIGYNIDAEMTRKKKKSKRRNDDFGFDFF